MLTYPHNDGDIHVNSVIPENAVNLCYYNIRKPNIDENVFISNDISINNYKYLELTPEIQDVNSKYFLLTNKSIIRNEERIPLFYSHKLKYQNNNDNISLVADDVTSDSHVQIYLVETSPNVFEYVLFTNYISNGITKAYVIYDAIINDKVVVNYKEEIQPNPYMTRKEIPGNLNNNEYRLIEVQDKITLERPTNEIYYLLPLDLENIHLKDPIEINSKWYTRIVNGTIEKYISNIAIPLNAKYTIPDYYLQEFADIGIPYMQVNEIPEYIDINTIKVRNNPIYIGHNDVNDMIQITVNNTPVLVNNIDLFNGLIYVNVILNPTDNINVTYYYIENSYIYKGYNYMNSNGALEFVPLDLNPIYNENNPQKHIYGYVDENGIIQKEESFKLLNKIVYLYIKPALLEAAGLSNYIDFTVNSIESETIELPKNKELKSFVEINTTYIIIKEKYNTLIRTKYSNKIIPKYEEGIIGPSWEYVENTSKTIKINNSKLLSEEPIVVTYLTNNPEESLFDKKVLTENVIFHTIEELTIEQELAKKAILIGKIFVRPNTNINNLNIIDTRTRGGGIKEISEELRKAYSKESEYYYDISDVVYGEPIQKNNVIIINIDNALLKENGGNFTRTDIENAINKYKAYGTVPIIKYTDNIKHRNIK